MDNEELPDNILAYFKQTCSVLEFKTLTFTIPTGVWFAQRGILAAKKKQLE